MDSGSFSFIWFMLGIFAIYYWWKCAPSIKKATLQCFFELWLAFTMGPLYLIGRFTATKAGWLSCDDGTFMIKAHK